MDERSISIGRASLLTTVGRSNEQDEDERRRNSLSTTTTTSVSLFFSLSFSSSPFSLFADGITSCVRGEESALRRCFSLDYDHHQRVYLLLSFSFYLDLKISLCLLCSAAGYSSSFSNHFFRSYHRSNKRPRAHAGLSFASKYCVFEKINLD